METDPVSVGTQGVLGKVWAVPGASRTVIVGPHGGHIKIRVSAAPVGGRANRAIEELLERNLGAHVSLIRGMSSREKVFHVSGTQPDEVRRKLGLLG
jgi:uncharacterized protein (TIGR00251 family)